MGFAAFYAGAVTAALFTGRKSAVLHGGSLEIAVKKNIMVDDERKSI